MSELTPSAAIARIDEWRGKDVDVRELGGGITNRNFVITVDGGRGGKYVMRIPGAGTDTFIDRERELGNHIAAAEAGTTPPVLYTWSRRSAPSCPSSRARPCTRRTLRGIRTGCARSWT